MPAVDFDFVLRFLNITLMDLALSGDNALVIGMSAASLPPGKRRLAIFVGGALAIVLRILLTLIATLLTLVPFLSAAGGIVLVWVAWKLVSMDTEGAAGGKVESSARGGTLRGAIAIILLADITMSLDNVIAVAGSAHGSIPLLVSGLVISMPLLMVTGGFISSLIDRAKWLVYVGAAAISFTAARMVFEDAAIAERIRMSSTIELVSAGVFGVIVPVVSVLFRDASRRRRKMGSLEAHAHLDRNTPSGGQEE